MSIDSGNGVRVEEARCDQGKLSGVSEKGVLSFFDIPYATDGGRFRDALPPVPWPGVRDGTRPGPVFPQLPSRLDFVMGPTARGAETSEDAFRVNVFTPSLAGRLPVLFWIHGGGFLTGGGALSCYNGAELARSGRAVVVTINYRLGILGNLYLPGVSEGNHSVRDIAAALNWVRDNIAHFGGDPAAIVIAGQSAGAWYTQLLMAMESTSPIPRSAIMLSYPGIEPRSPDEAHSLAEDYCKLGEIDAPARVLPGMPIDAVLAVQAKLLASKAAFASVPIGFMPVRDSQVPANPTRAAARFAPKPLMIGWTREETGSFFASNPALVSASAEAARKRFEQMLGADGAICYEQLVNRRVQGSPFSALVDLTSEALFRQPSIRLAEHIAENGGAVFAYQFDFPSPQPYVGAGHCYELPFFFGNFGHWPDAPMIAGLDTVKAHALSSRMQSYLLDFMDTGNPNSATRPVWHRYERDRLRCLHFDEVIGCTGDAERVGQ
ncbi:carboxylesterase/lipase family protein [Paraburkholderia nodosa]|uniref:carboxylesterase/lipase family protein n=1 Tax=Paraburkholderia nodosa TaxID=392320 RepID=UPI0004AFAC54|nr:carboxylesterase family protein [Paraburkholderia nodosa]